MEINLVDEFRNKLAANIGQVILGKPDVIDLVIMSIICDGHILVEDVPGTGKTVLAKSAARSLDAQFSRIQFTPDMLPSDVTGVSIYNQSNHEFEFRAGPIIANIVLADEINRATPKTQSALLEAMEERQVTVDGKTHFLPDFFLVIATQNPIEFEGTFPLPEAQLDRFLIRLAVGYPLTESERAILKSQQYSHPLNEISPVADVRELLKVREEIKSVFVSEKIERYIVDIAHKTRHHEDIYLGVSPRGSLALYRLGQCQAVFNGRDFVIPDDIKKVAPNALAHRIIPSPTTRLSDFRPEEMIAGIVDQVPVPVV
jgi:MoxR-like ATPase